MSYALQQCKNFENRLRFNKVTDSLKVVTFFRHSVVVAPQIGQGIMPNTVGESLGISFLKLNGNADTIFSQSSELAECRYSCWLTFVGHMTILICRHLPSHVRHLLRGLLPSQLCYVSVFIACILTERSNSRR